MPRLVGQISRSSEIREMNLDKIKGTLVDFNELEHVLDDAPHVGAWQVELRKVHDDPLESGRNHSAREQDQRRGRRAACAAN